MKINPLFRFALLAPLAFVAATVGLVLLAASWPGDLTQAVERLFSPTIRSSIWLSLWTSILSTSLALLVGVPAAYAFARDKIPGRAGLRLLLDLPLVLPPIVTGLGLLILAGFWPGFATESAGRHFGPLMVIIAQMTLAIPLAVRLLIDTFERIPTRVETMSRTLGLSAAHTFVRVSLPLARNGIVCSALLVWTRALSIFAPILIFAGAIEQRNDVLPIAILRDAGGGDLEGAKVMALLLVFVAIIVLLAIRRLGGRLLVG